ncbi:hypothetical protein F1C10_00090 [Sphingomonas sp. NBWT7]|uniref:hypothetical protein n=1 Tax=Sphingomonas sp. NBWT7 TaxID=2596913 RepID=UPI00162A8483|nr:hypothetical protein [Sphingomonas sp. NBWT7]QNE30545.1 hypothetical protein F1C10_00090 [Sphingomonas sp. NBWT7]
MTLFALTAALALGTAAAAPVAPSSDQVAVTQPTLALDPGSDNRRVCVVEQRVGTLIARKTCQTRAAWVAQGIDPLAAR